MANKLPEGMTNKLLDRNANKASEKKLITNKPPDGTANNPSDRKGQKTALHNGNKTTK